MTITELRENVIDFSKPYKTTGISVAMKRTHVKRTLFQFTRPFSGMVWLLLVGVVVIVSITLYVLHKVSPSDDDSVCFSEQDAVWFTLSSLFLRTTDFTPKTVSGRILAGALWFFSLILITSYTANLAAFLTVSRLVTPMLSMGDLAGQTRVKYGTVRNSYVSTFFGTNRLEFFQRMWHVMSQTEPVSMVNSTDEGFYRVRNSNGDYAFIWDSTVIKHQSIEHCDLIEIGQSFDTRGYGFAVPRGVSYRDELSMSILKLRENGRLQEMENR